MGKRIEGKLSYISSSQIRPNPSQPRKIFEKEELETLAESIRQYGILQPLTVRRTSGGFELVAGERRLRAAKIAGVTRLPCIILDVDRSSQSILALVENLHRADLDFIEEAEGIYNLINTFGLSQEEAARKIGKSQSAVANKLRLLRLPGELLYVIREAGLTERHARALLRIEDDKLRVAALEKIIKEDMNVKKAEEYIASLLTPEQKKQKNTPHSLYVLKDVRLFLNTVTHGMEIMREAGIDAEYGKDETDTDIILTIRIPKKPAKKAV